MAIHVKGAIYSKCKEQCRVLKKLFVRVVCINIFLDFTISVCLKGTMETACIIKCSLIQTMNLLCCVNTQIPHTELR